jgi:hypothetical protein
MAASLSLNESVTEAAELLIVYLDYFHRYRFIRTMEPYYDMGEEKKEKRCVWCGDPTTRERFCSASCATDYYNKLEELGQVAGVSSQKATAAARRSVLMHGEE